MTETDLEHLQALRRTYPERMAAEREKAEKLKSDQAGARLAYELVFGVPARCSSSSSPPVFYKPLMLVFSCSRSCGLSAFPLSILDYVN